MTMKRSGSAVWFGDLRTGDGSLTARSGALDQIPYNYANRFENSPGTSPEELMATAHAGCYTMAVCAALSSAGFNPTRLATQAVMDLELVDGLWTLTASHLEMRAAVPGISAERFAAIAGEAGKTCPVSRALKVEITLDAQLDSDR